MAPVGVSDKGPSGRGKSVRYQGRLPSFFLVKRIAENALNFFPTVQLA